MDAWIISYVGSGLELKHMEKGKIVLPWDDFFAPARRACGRRFYWGGRGCTEITGNNTEIYGNNKIQDSFLDFLHARGRASRA